MDLNTRDVVLDSVMYSILFYVLSNRKMYDMTSRIFPRFRDRVFLHTIVYMLVYLIIQKMTRRF